MTWSQVRLSKPRSSTKLLLAILLCQSAGGVGAAATSRSVNSWYRDLEKPSFNPPGWVFGPVWTVLYSLMGIALYLATESETGVRERRLAESIFGGQLLLNAAWPLLFFGRRLPLAALIEIVALWSAIVATIMTFWRLSKTAAILLVPYLVWTTFAAILNFSVWHRNRKGY